MSRQHDSDDRRVVTLSLADAGAREIRELHLNRRQRMATALAHLSDAERAQLLASVRSLRAAFNRVMQEGAPA